MGVSIHRPRSACALLCASLLVAVAPATAIAANGGAGPGEVSKPTPKPRPKPKHKVKVDPESGGGAMPGQSAPRKPTRPKRPKKKPTKRPAKKPVKKPAKKPVTPPRDPGFPAGIFPVRGDHDYGGVDSRFGAQRSGHTHQGQDLSAAEGVPIVAPVAATVLYRGFQAGGAGNYLVLHGADGRDYVFMHLMDRSLRVSEGGAVTKGMRIAQVGNTGHSSGPHLHFEIWVGGWQSGGHPIDPLPFLKAWDRTS